MIPLSVPNLSGNEWKYVKDCLDTNWVSSVGSYVNQMEEVSASFCGVAKAIATSNGTSALHIALLLAGVERGDLVILPNITFVAPANVIKYLGADTVLIDVYEDTWQLDVDLLKKFLEEECIYQDNACYHKATGRKISAIVPVHVLGNMVNLDMLLPLAESYNIQVVEDATESLGSTYDNKPAGSFGLFGCLSYNGNKIITTGGGGMILTNNIELAKKAKHLTTQAKVDGIEYYHDEIGYNYRMVNILAAIGVAQMEQLPGFITHKRNISKLYTEGLKNIKGFKPQKTTDKVISNSWLYTAVFERSKQLFEYLEQHGVQTRPFWVPMNRLPAFASDIYYNENDVAGNVYSNCLSLPCSTGIANEEVEKVIEKINQFYA
ncbi:LegC family aminotransferase [Mucilaginibacter sp. OK098]|uniref:LegC family aminotransferase n=1 Tax=Mucilaginibacter sp. OK098 TaxID=1855297 RepID=UPI00091B2F75|nr:LegC family aminotransferase [Mucilaginibacter sp. OK098]SHL92962.1 DegT/DnrJ/EryC1/StrS aminotransferase family protein [Mucilaginibacter sp. OK098]